MELNIVIATYNRESNLRVFLSELTRQVVPENLLWKVVVVDNNSNDATRQVVEQFIAETPHRFQYVFEPRQGKSIALNAGVLVSTGDVLVFTDDDCIPDPRWLATIASEFAKDNVLDVLGGRVALYNQADRPVTIRDFPDRTLIDSSDKLFLYLVGANMSVRRKVFELIGNFDPFLGPGSRLGAVMEDLDFLYRAFRQGLKMVYAPEVKVFHNHGRTSDAQIHALNRKYVVGRGAFYCKHIFGQDTKVLKMAYWEVSSQCKAFCQNLLRRKAVGKELRLLSALATGAVGRLLWNPVIRRS
jgi:glycosyltransferase involved in cell wall biosynthesis